MVQEVAGGPQPERALSGKLPLHRLPPVETRLIEGRSEAGFCAIVKHIDGAWPI
jgi:hypothetical protein